MKGAVTLKYKYVELNFNCKNLQMKTIYCIKGIKLI